ncbi:MAG: exo-beta-N-acetylmuramidase NamZ domain-containing protein [Gemmatimonas sp.]|uniref:exo-beta-N-acetylmuramidase NamZ family protein n=1 Tax=Gemmatimonas sp. TaxID=1962908 RepID=UPI00391F6529
MKAIKRLVWWSAIGIGMVVAGCARSGPPDGGPTPDDGIDDPRGGGMRRQVPDRKVRPGITVLLDDSIKLVAGKRVALVTNQTGVDERGRRSIDLLFGDPRALRAGVKLVKLFAPEHGARGTEDRSGLGDERDEKTGLVVHSLYQRSTMAPADSLLQDVDVLVVDLQDIGTRTWTYVGVVLYAMQAGERRNLPVLVLDRPNPIAGTFTEGALLDSALADASYPTASNTTNGFSLFPMPLRHGLTMGELARLFQANLKMSTRLTVVPMRNWRRGLWFDQTGLPWVRPSPNMPSVTTALFYPALVPFEASNVSVGRGTDQPFQQFGAPWLRADSVARLLEDLSLTGVRFKADRFTPDKPGDNKYGGRSIPGVRLDLLDRERVQPARIGAAILWALARVHRDSLQINGPGFDRRMGSARMREALLGGADPDAVLDRLLPAIVAFEKEARRFHLYR